LILIADTRIVRNFSAKSHVDYGRRIISAGHACIHRKSAQLNLWKHAAMKICAVSNYMHRLASVLNTRLTIALCLVRPKYWLAAWNSFFSGSTAQLFSCVFQVGIDMVRVAYESSHYQ